MPKHKPACLIFFCFNFYYFLLALTFKIAIFAQHVNIGARYFVWQILATIQLITLNLFNTLFSKQWTLFSNFLDQPCLLTVNFYIYLNDKPTRRLHAVQRHFEMDKTFCNMTSSVQTTRIRSSYPLSKFDVGERLLRCCFYFYIKNVTIFLTEKKIFFLLEYNVANALLLSVSTTTNLFSLQTNLTKCVLSSPSTNATLFQLLFNYLTSLTLLTELDITASHRNPLNAWWRVSSTWWRHWPHVSFQVRSNLQPARTFRK